MAWTEGWQGRWREGWQGRWREGCTSETHVGRKPAQLGGIWDVEGERKEKSGRTPTFLALQIGGHGCHLLRWGTM